MTNTSEEWCWTLQSQYDKLQTELQSTNSAAESTKNESMNTIRENEAHIQELYDMFQE